MRFDCAASPVGGLLQSPFHGVESIADSHEQVLVPVVRVRRTVHHEFAGGNSHIETDMVDLAAMLMLVRRIENDATSDDVIMMAVEPRRVLAHARLHRWRWVH